MNWDNIIDSVFNGNIAGLPQLVKDALAEGLSPGEILNKGLIAGMSIVGEKFKANDIFVPEVLIAARAMQAGMDILEPLLVETGVEPKGKIIIGTAKGDLHDIGKNLVVMMFKGNGFFVADMGIDVPPEKFLEEATRENAQVIAISSLLTTSMPSMKDTVELLRKKGLGGKIKIIIGGAPVTQEYADSIGADGYAQDASSAVDKAKELLNI